MENIVEKLKQKYSLQQSKDSVKEIVIPTFLRLSLCGILDKFYSVPDEYKTDWNKLLLDVKKNRGVISTLIKGLFGVYGGKMTFMYDIDTNGVSSKDVTMVFAGTPNKVQQTGLVKVFQESLGPQYEVVLINGNETSNRNVEEKCVGIINKAKRDGKKVVLISKDMGSRSFSVSEIDTVILMYDRGSFAVNSQKISRVLTPGKTYSNDIKTEGYIISLSLDPNREEVNPIDEYILYESERVINYELSDGIKNVLRSVNLFVNDGDELVGVELDKYCERLIESSSLIRLGKSSTKPDSIISDGDLVKLITGIDNNVHNKNKEKLEGVDSSLVIKTRDIGIDNKKSTKEKDDELKKIFNTREKIKQQLNNIVDHIVVISEINSCESDDIIICLDMIIEKGLDGEVIFDVDMGCETIKKIILLGGLSRKLLNTIITSYNKVENSLLF